MPERQSSGTVDNSKLSNRGAHRPRKHGRAAARSMLTQAAAAQREVEQAVVLATPAHAGQPLSPAKRRQQRRLPRSPVPTRSAAPALTPDGAAAGSSTAVAAVQRACRRQRDRAQLPDGVLLTEPARDHWLESGVAWQLAPVLQEAYPPPALLAARAAAKAALDPGNGRPPARVLAGLTKDASAAAIPHFLQGRPTTASVVARKRRPPKVLTLAQLQKRYGSRRHRRRAAAELLMQQSGSAAVPERSVEAADDIAAVPEQAVNEARGGITAGIAAAAALGADGSGAEPSWEWMVEGVLRQVVLHLDAPNSVVHFRQVHGIQACCHGRTDCSPAHARIHMSVDHVRRQDMCKGYGHI